MSPHRIVGGGADLFPLPLFNNASLKRPGLSRSVRHRIGKRMHLVENANGVVASLNYLSGVQEKAPLRPSSARDEVLSHVLDACEKFSPTFDVEAPEASLTALLGKVSSVYEDRPSGPVKYEFSKLSLPDSAGGCNLLEALDGDDLEDLKNFDSHCFLSEAEIQAKVSAQGKPRSFYAPELAGGGKEYEKLVQSLYSKRMVSFTRRKKCGVGLFVVSKKDGRLRLIIDCRKLNFQLRAPPKTKLASTSSFSEVNIGSGDSMYYSSHDVCDCFYQFEVPDWLSPYLCLEPVSLHSMGFTTFEGLPVTSDCMAYPCLTVLPMGFAYAQH